MLINCDYGEGYGLYDLEIEASVLKNVHMVNIACGFHAGDPLKMMQAIQLAKKYNIKIGAHPSYYDLRGFGRNEMNVSKEILMADLIYQIAALEGMCKSLGTELFHVKAHGALYNQCMKDSDIADVVLESIIRVNPKLYVVGLSGSDFLKQAEEKGLKVLHEVFSDRRYNKDGHLVSRSKSNALLSLEESKTQILELQNNRVKVDEEFIDLKSDTLCIHGDGAHASELINFVKLFQEG